MPLLSIVQKHVQFSSIKPSYTKKIDSWKEYKIVKEFIEKFTNTSPNEALSNALELRDLSAHLKDSIKPKIFETPAFESRINVFHNETLRLADMTFIRAIKASEVNHQIDKTLLAFSSMNSKINTVFSQKTFEDAIDIDDAFIGLDTTKIDRISLKSIQDNDEKMKKQSANSLKKTPPKRLDRSVIERSRKKVKKS